MKIFHRIDDVNIYSREMLTVMDFFSEHVREFIVAAIPYNFSKVMASHMRAYKNCSIYQHGYQHINRVSKGWCDEFPNSFCILKTRSFITTGKTILEDLFLHTIKGYVPPWNNTGEKTVKILEELGYEIYSAQKNHTIPYKVNRDIDIDIVNTYVPIMSYRSLEKIFKEVEAMAHKDIEIGIMYHMRNISECNLNEIFNFVNNVEALQGNEKRLKERDV